MAFILYPAPTDTASTLRSLSNKSTTDRPGIGQSECERKIGPSGSDTPCDTHRGRGRSRCSSTSRTISVFVMTACVERRTDYRRRDGKGVRDNSLSCGSACNRWAASQSRTGYAKDESGVWHLDGVVSVSLITTITRDTNFPVLRTDIRAESSLNCSS